jgi:hypothetical protein
VEICGPAIEPAVKVPGTTSAVKAFSDNSGGPTVLELLAARLLRVLSMGLSALQNGAFRPPPDVGLTADQ